MTVAGSVTLPGMSTHEGDHADQQQRRGFAQRLGKADDRSGQDAGHAASGST
jgi:hypothetical protein